MTLEVSVGPNGEMVCDHRLLPVTFDDLGGGRYRVVMPIDGAVIHECSTDSERAEVGANIAEIDRRLGKGRR